MQTLDISKFDVIFLSYDEPNADKNYSHLLRIIPTAKRVHGVKGSDAAHKACANLSETDRFFVVDGDNWVKEDFRQQVLSLDNSVDINNSVLSWPALNIINGLMYGNGGIKCWPKHLALSMRTHEAAEPDDVKGQVDFCWHINYIPIDKCFSHIVNNGTPLQAWRAGFREGVKMSLNQGRKVRRLSELDASNLNRLRIWMTVGEDMQWGDWAMDGALHGCYLTHFKDWDFTQVRDFDVLNDLYIQSMGIKHERFSMLRVIKEQLNVPDRLTADQSRFFKSFNFNPDRQPKTIYSRDSDLYDIVMITYGEANAEENWQALVKRFPRAMRVDGVTGIHNAHKSAAAKATSKMFWVVDGDTKVFDNFDFDYIVPRLKQDIVHVWRARNPINGLEYGYGGIKLLPTQLTLDMDTSKPDMTTSISTKYKPVFEVASITAFDTDGFSTWRSAFRECTKLASKVIDRQKDDETNKRLNTWGSTYVGSFGAECLSGALAGRAYGEQNTGDVEALKKINDFDWLKERFNERN